MIQTIEAPNGGGHIRIEGSKGHYTLKTSFIPFGEVRFIEELEKRLHVKKVARTTTGGVFFVEISSNPERLTIAEIVMEVVEESKVFEHG